jgi:hypothetical protein
MDPPGPGALNLPPTDADFLRIFLPYELRLAQRRAMTWDTTPIDELPAVFLGLYLVRLQPLEAPTAPAPDYGGTEIDEHLHEVLRSVLRDSDMAVHLSPTEHLAIARDLEPAQSYTVAQRLLSRLGHSQVLRAAGLGVRVGYVVYPLSTQPNYPPADWTTLVDLARRVGARGGSAAVATGFGVMRGPHLAEANLPECDLVPLAFEDLDALVKAGILRLQRIHLLPGV